MRVSTRGGKGTRYRWTQRRARLRLFSWTGQRPQRLSVSYLSGVRPPGVPPARPQLDFNGHRLRGKTHREPAGEIERVTLSFDLPAEWVKPGLNELGIRSATWTPTKWTPWVRRWSDIGIMLDSVTLEPISSS